MGTHRRLKPDCPFITNPVSSGNVPINVQPPTSEVASNDLMNEQCRLATFTNWPVSETQFQSHINLKFYFIFILI